MTVNHYENFPVASLLLPRHLRHPVAQIYRFAREADDFADEGDAPDDVRIGQLASFDAELHRIEQGLAPEIPWFSTLGAVIRDYHLPLDAFSDLLSAFTQDVSKKRYAGFDEVLDYCRRSANPVGRLLLELFGAATPQNLAHSDAICSSLQIINFLQDIAVDFAKGRVYMPQDELARFQISETQIAHGDTSGNWSAFMTYQVDRARELLMRGAPLGTRLKGRIGLELRMTVQGGNRILEKISRVRGDVFRHRPILKWFDWPLLLARSL